MPRRVDELEPLGNPELHRPAVAGRYEEPRSRVKSELEAVFLNSHQPRITAQDPITRARLANVGRNIVKARIVIAAVKMMAIPAGEPVPFVTLFALVIGGIGLAAVSRVRQM